MCVGFACRSGDMEIAWLGWCFPLTVPWGNAWTTPWQYTGNTLAVPWQYPGSTQAVGSRASRILVCEDQSTDCHIPWAPAMHGLMPRVTWAHAKGHMGCMLALSEVSHPL